MFYPSGLTMNYIVFISVPLVGAIALFQEGYWYLSILCLPLSYGGYRLARHIEDWFWNEIRKDAMRRIEEEKK